MTTSPDSTDVLWIVDSRGTCKRVKLPLHGLTRYRKWRCRCVECREANADYQRQRRGGGRARELQHGTRACYVSGCRRPECTQANRDYQREYMRLHRRGITASDPWIDEALR